MFINNSFQTVLSFFEQSPGGSHNNNDRHESKGTDRFERTHSAKTISYCPKNNALMMFHRNSWFTNALDKAMSALENSRQARAEEQESENPALDDTLKTGTDTDNVSVIGSSDTSVFTGDGDDSIFAAFSKANILAAGEGNDSVASLFAESDFISTGEGSDSVTTFNSAFSNIYTGGGNDLLAAGNVVNSFMSTGAGDDLVDTMFTSYSSIDAGDGDDVMLSEFTYNNTISMGDGDDTVAAVFSNNNKIDTGSGNDNVVIYQSTGNVINTGDGNDRVVLDKALTLAAAMPGTRVHFPTFTATVNGGTGDDYIKANGLYNARLDGGEGNDYLSGAGILNGGTGDDIIDGDGIIKGGEGNDTILGTGYIEGGEGDDVIMVDSDAYIDGVDFKLHGRHAGPAVVSYSKGDGNDKIFTDKSDLSLLMNDISMDDADIFVNSNEDTGATEVLVKMKDGSGQVLITPGSLNDGGKVTGSIIFSDGSINLG